MYQAPLPAEYAELTADEARSRIVEAKRVLGKKVVILGHHYQRDEIIEHADYRGDSFKLAKDANRHPEAGFIVFCGVHFMAESADILTPDHQKVILPNLAAGCSMADMANLFQVRNCWRDLENLVREQTVIPVTYINSAASLKAFVGERGGTVCTSTNAPKAVEWAISQGQKVLFFPDQHLGRNTGAKMGYNPLRDMVVWDPHKPLGGNSEDEIARATFILWKGHCSVHQRFTVEQIESARKQHVQIKILVHPECPIEVVEASDLNGSTEFIINTVNASEPGSAWAIGTEINLVNRLAKENPDKTVFCLDPMICPCATMYRIHPSFLLYALEKLVEGDPINIVEVPQKTKDFAKVALDRMLTLV